jgi:hypothetical protein
MYGTNQKRVSHVLIFYILALWTINNRAGSPRGIPLAEGGGLVPWTRDGNGQGRVRIKHLAYPSNSFVPLPAKCNGKNPYPYPYPYPQGTRKVKGYPMGININMSLSSYIIVQ